MRNLFLDSIFKELDNNQSDNIKCVEAKTLVLLKKYPEKAEAFYTVLEAQLSAYYNYSASDSTASEPLIKENNTAKLYDLAAYCKFLNIKTNSNSYNSLKEKMNQSRKNGSLIGKQEKKGSKCYFTLDSLKEFTLLKMPEYIDIFQKSIAQIGGVSRNV